MLLDVIEQAAKGVIHKVIPPMQRYFTYFFIFLGIIWLGSANYYYYAEEYTKFKGALISGLIFLALASCTALWEYYMKRIKVEKNSREELLTQMLPIFMPVFFGLFKKIVLNPKAIKTLAIIGIIGSGLYYGLTKKRDS